MPLLIWFWKASTWTRDANWIFKISDDGSAAYKVDIRLGSQNTKYHEVLEGLNPGDKVITSSYDSFANIDELIIED